jgi:monoterpene epsilon-lactone hydrolase
MRPFRSALLFAVLGVAQSTVAQTDATQLRVVPARTIPVPDTVSVQMRNMIARAPMTPVAPRNAEEWKALVAAASDVEMTRIAALRKHFNVEVAERTIAGVRCYEVTPADVPARNRNRLLVNVHGGGYVFGPGEAGNLEAITMAGFSQMKVISIDYRMPPDFPFPAAMDDAMAVWKEVVRRVRPTRIGLFGTSTGGGMTLLMVQRAKSEGLPLPAAIAPGTPWSDLSKTGDSYFTNESIDNALGSYEPLLSAAARLYANGVDLKDPRLSPVYGGFTGFPPTILTTGTRDLFLSNTVRVHRKLREAGVEAQLEVYEGQSHAQYIPDPTAPETEVAFGAITRFFDAHLSP